MIPSTASVQDIEIRRKRMFHKEKMLDSIIEKVEKYLIEIK